MKLFILRANEDQAIWDPWYDKTFGMIVRAADESSARKLAATKPGDEGEQAWLNTKNSTCEELIAEGEETILMQDRRCA